jgi:RND superfamily putative drug exporter
MKFFKGLGNAVVKLRFVILAFWLAAAAVLYFTAPVLSEVAKTDEASFLSNDTETAKAAALYKELFPEAGNRSGLILVLTDDGGLNDADRQYGRDLQAFLEANKESYHVQEVSSPFTDSELESAMLSADGKAAVMSVSLGTPGYLDVTNEAVKKLRADINGGEASASAPALPQGLTAHITGDAPLGQEQIDNVKSSLDRTTKITIGLIVVILLLIYRSPVAPILPLGTIGLSFVISRGIVALLTTLGLKVSSMTEIFLIAVLFGAGTDYCLLLISRYREEITAGRTPREALEAAFPHTSAAILSSGGTVIIGFIGMVLAKFGLFNSTGPSIAIGVGVTVLAVLTLTPALLSILGERIFWPAHPSKNREKAQGGSRFWNNLSSLVTRKPVTFMLVALAAFTPFIVFSANVSRSFDMLRELPAASDTVKGFDEIKAHFDQGEMLPLTVTLKSDRGLWDNESLQAIDNVAQDLLKVDGVAKVRTATRPGGEPINEISLPSQIEALTQGIGKSDEGFGALSDGLTQAKDGVGQVNAGIDEGISGLNDLSDGTKQASDGIGDVGSGLGKLSSAESGAISGVNKLKSGMDSLNTGLSQTKAGINGLLGGLNSAKHSLDLLVASNPALAMDVNFQTAYGTITALIGNIPALNAGIDALADGVAQSKGGLTDAANGLKQIKSGIDQSRSALKEVQGGLGDIGAGQDEMASQMGTASDSLKQISDGLGQSIDGIAEMKDAMAGAGQSADDWAQGLNGLNSVFYLPEGTLNKYPELRDYMQTYISQDGHGVKFSVVLSEPPYDQAALDSVAKIEDAVRFSLKNGPLEGSEFHVSGSTAAVSEVRQITADDFIKVMVFVLLGIFVVLAILLRSLTAPFYLIITILVSYLTTLGVSCLVFQGALGYAGLSWAVPFFSFCLLVALGVDYNIFLMSRVKEEYAPGQMREGTRRALASTGGIITSCGLIMAGTFGALLFSPVTELVQVGFTTVVGLLLDTFIVRCMLVPAIAVKVGELNWWPGRKVKLVAVEKTNISKDIGM